MNTTSNSYYKVGGSLEPNAPSYGVRQADEDFYQALKAGEFCYVLNSRQMGKSSLRVRTVGRLEAEGIACSQIDITSIGSRGITASEWYWGVVRRLARSFKTSIDLKTWWQERAEASPVDRLSQFIEEVLLVEVQSSIAIFIDEIDSILNLDFKDDFFALIRTCYNQRAENPEYRRLTFALLGVATPSDLVQDKSRTPFNIGRSIDLRGLQLHEAEPLAQGLQEKAEDAISVLHEILDWTGGQPFLTQKVCQFVQVEAEQIPVGQEAERVRAVVWSRVIENWEGQDEPEHLRTIQNRVRIDEQQLGKLLGLYQQILQQGEIVADDSPEQVMLRLTGLVIRRDGKLQVYNRIYITVFNAQWVNRAFADLRPTFYAEAMRLWQESDQNESFLLRGQALAEAGEWAKDRRLSDGDEKFLQASRDREAAVQKNRLVVMEEEAQILGAAKRKAERRIQVGSAILGTTLLVAGGIGVWASMSVLAIKLGDVRLLSANSQADFFANRELDAMLKALNAVAQLTQLDRAIWKKDGTQLQAVSALQQAVYSLQEQNRLEGHDGAVRSVSFSPDGQTIATGSFDHTVKLWTRQGNLVKTLSGHQGWVNSISFSPDGDTIATGSADGTAKLWSRQGNLLRTLSGHQGWVNSISFSPDGDTIATGDAGTVKLWSRQGNLLKTLSDHQGIVYSVSFSPDGDIIATGDAGTVKLWSRQGNLLKTLSDHQGIVYSVSFSPDGETLATGSDDHTVKLWTRQGTLLTTLSEHQNRVWSISFNPYGDTIATGSADGTVKLWSRQGNLLKTLSGHQSIVYSVSFSPNGEALATGSLDGTVKLWDQQGTLPMTLSHQKFLRSVSFSPDGDTIATGGEDHIVRLWSRQGNLLKILSGHQAPVRSVNFSPDRKTLVTGSYDGTVRLWSRQGKLLNILPGHRGGVFSTSFSPDGDTIATGGADHTIKLWNRQGSLLITLSEHQDAVRSVSFSPDGETLATGSDDRTVKLWNRQGNLLKTLSKHQDAVRSISFSPDGEMLATASADQTVKLWSRQGELLKTLSGHQGYVHSVSFSPDGEAIATASSDYTVKLWNRQGRLLATLVGHQNWVNSVSFSPDGEMLASASGDGTVKLWDFQVERLLAMGCYWTKDIQHQQSKLLSVCQTPNIKAALPNLLLTQAEEIARRGNYIRAVAILQDVKKYDPRLEVNAYTAYFRSLAGKPLIQRALGRANLNLVDQENKIVWANLSETLRATASGKSFSDQLKHFTSLTKSRLAQARWLLVRAKEIDPALDLAAQTLVVKKTLQTSINKVVNALLDRGNELARSGQLNDAITEYRYALQINPDLDLDPLAQAQAQALIEHAIELAEKGKITSALNAIQQVQVQSPQVVIDSTSWNQLCWFGSLYSQSSQVLKSCEQAVTLDPDNGVYRDSRGLARALTGNRAGAVDDFNYFLTSPASANPCYSDYVINLRIWIEDLQTGKNPFTLTVLDSLKKTKCAGEGIKRQ